MHIIQIYGRVCRVCMCKRNNLHNLNDIAEEYSLSIEEMLQKTLHQKTKQFPVPREICMECMDHLYIAYRFQEMCWNTNDQLYKIWEKSHKATDEESVEVDEEMKHCVERCDDDDLDPIKLESAMEEAADAKSSTSQLTLESNKKSNNESGEQRLEIEGNGANDETFGNGDTGTTKLFRCSRGKPIQHARRRGKHNTTIQLHMCKICFYPNKTKDLLQQHMSECHKHIKEDEKADKTHHNVNDDDYNDDDDDYEDDENVPLSSLRKNGNSLSEDINLCSGVIAEEGEGSNEEDKQSPGDISIQPTNSTNYCPTCNKQFKYTHHLAKHQCKTKTISTHSHSCEICSKEFSSANMLQKHKRSKHQEIKTSRKANIKDIVQQSEDMQQKLCSSLTKGKQGITEGNEMNDIRDSDYTLAENDEDGDEENADDADYVDTEQESLKTKTPSATSNDYRCTECNASFRFEKQLERHIKKHTEAHKFVCVVCNDRFKYPFMLQKHTERHHPEESTKRNVTENKKDNLEKSHTCNYCPSAYTNVGGLAQHMSKKHPEIVPFKCDKCDKTFVVEEHLKIHTNRHMGIKNFKCELCDKSFSFKFAMKQHMRIHTGDLNYLCTLCGKKFYRPSNLRQHMQRHGDEKPYSCPHCPKRFKCPSDRYIHLMSHQEGKNHVCSTCGARFSRVDTLHQHQVLHTGEKPYKCDQCPMAFPRLMNLNRHLRTHTGEKPYKCKYCDKAYAQSNDLNKHLRTHIGENTYICTQCPAAFKYQADLRNHEWDHYRKQKEEEQRCQGDVTMNEKEIKAPETIMECNK